MLTNKNIFSFFRRQLRVHVFKLLGSNKRYVTIDFTRKILIFFLEFFIGIANRSDNCRNKDAKSIFIAFFACNYPLPVPLVSINRVQIIHLFIAADCIHICIYAFPRLKSIPKKRHTFPFCKRMDNLRPYIGICYVKAYRPFGSVKVIIKTGKRIYKKRRCHTFKI